MITEQELEMALELREKIKDLKQTIAKLESVVIANNTALNNGISIDCIKIKVNNYTRNMLVKFKEDVLAAHKEQLEDLRTKYKEIIESPDDTLRRIIEEQDG